VIRIKRRRRPEEGRKGVGSERLTRG